VNKPDKARNYLTPPVPRAIFVQRDSSRRISGMTDPTPTPTPTTPSIPISLTLDQRAMLDQINWILFPHYSRRADEIKKKNGRFVHYTSAENALKIIKDKCIWMRNTTCMSDYREVHHGLDALNRYFSNATNKQAFADALNGCSTGIAEEAFALFNQWWQATQLQTYITSISEHDEREDFHGRLSMWRAFGNSTARVAIVVKLSLDIGKNIALAATLMPVGYFTDDELVREMESILQNVRDNEAFLRKVDRGSLLASIFALLVSSVVCMKHEGFAEEREWRVIPIR
jgi:hypothetical protein